MLIRIFYFVSIVISKLTFPDPFPSECYRAGSSSTCKGSNCPPCWAASTNNDGFDCYDYKSSNKCPDFAEDVSSYWDKTPSKSTSSSKDTPITDTPPNTSKKPQQTTPPNPGPTSNPSPSLPNRSYKSTTTIVVRKTVDNSSTNHLNPSQLLLFIILAAL